MLTILEALLVFAAIEAYIWRLRYTAGWSWIVILGAMLLSHALHGETPRSLGFRMDNFGDAARRFGPAVAVIASLILLFGIGLHSFRALTNLSYTGSFAVYLLWGCFQQYTLNSYFGRRIQVQVVPAALFSAAHYPNFFLMAVTFVLGYAATVAYRRQPNIYFLGIAHGVIGFLLYWALPDAVTHHLNIGPGYR